MLAKQGTVGCQSPLPATPASDPPSSGAGLLSPGRLEGAALNEGGCLPDVPIQLSLSITPLSQLSPTLHLGFLSSVALDAHLDPSTPLGQQAHTYTSPHTQGVHLAAAER